MAAPGRVELDQRGFPVPRREVVGRDDDNARGVVSAVAVAVEVSLLLLLLLMVVSASAGEAFC